jgi:hypothetical protein
MYTATQEQIAEWKQKHGDIFLLKVGEKSCYLKSPSRKAMSYATVAGKTDPIKKFEVILNDAWLGGDEEIKTNDKLFLSSISYLDNLLDLEEANLEKL